MRKQMTDSQADHFILGGLVALALSCIHPVFGILVHLPLIGILVTKCGIKVKNFNAKILGLDKRFDAIDQIEESRKR